MDRLEQGISLAVGLLESGETQSLIKRADPQMRPTSAVEVMFSSVVLAGAPLPPEGIAVVPGRCERPWCVAVRPDDSTGLVFIEGYARSIVKPEKVEKISFPPR
jgi:hypothetical protein